MTPICMSETEYTKRPGVMLKILVFSFFPFSFFFSFLLHNERSLPRILRRGGDLQEGKKGKKVTALETVCVGCFCREKK